MSTLLCVPIMVEEVHQALADTELARALGADLVEFRIDTLFQGEGDVDGRDAVVRLVRDTVLPCIVTCRPAWEGGLYDGDDAARIALFEHLGALDHPPRYIDVEHAAFSRSANLRQKVRLAVHHPRQQRDLTTSLILSTHDFNGRPPTLHRTLAAMREDDTAAVTKLAWTARSLRDNLELFEILAHRDRPTIALAMGRFGLLSRVLAPKCGGFLTFAALRQSATTAPGQPTIRELLNLYRFRSITPATRVYGVIGWPVEQSRSPAMHNAGFEALDHDGVYLPLPVPPEWEHFKATLLALIDDPHLTFRGASVTIPHKEHLLRLARARREAGDHRWTIDPLVERIGAANTIAIDDAGAIRIANTDAAGAVAALRTALPDPSGARIAILGAGGAARAIALGLADAGAQVTLFNRTEERASELAAALAHVGVTITARPWQERATPEHDVWINATPIGMARPDDPDATSQSPLDEAQIDALPDQAVVFDTIYNPLQTRLLRDAAARGLTTISGLTMFVEQGARQAALWTGTAPDATPRALFGRVVRESLDPGE